NNAAPLDYPVPWSRDRTNSHLVTADGLKQVLADAGWGVCVWDDETEFARDWLESAKAPRGGGWLSLRSLIGNEFPKMVGNLRANFSDGRLGAIQAVLERTA
ncbi:MAG: SAM-dependent methyltransferase, partial [Alphaproteobacteria bacterium]